MRRIGIVGVGLLGSAVATRLLQRGFEVIGYDTRVAQVEALQPQGLRAATSVAEAAAEADAVFTFFPPSKASRRWCVALAKLVTNLLVALNTAALAEALVLGAKGGLDPATLLPALQHSAAGSRMLDVRGPLMVSGAFPHQMKLDLFLKDLRLMLDEGEQLSVPLPLTSTAQQLYAAAAVAGAQDLAVVITQLEHMVGLTRAPH
jgi:3-hydroxyisobutyrate dehydrogenase-like beta-hydroxyacid dehydrogenase